MALLLLILKITGIVLLSLICIFFLILFLLLFVPIRYKAFVKACGTVRSTIIGYELAWLLHIVSFRGGIKDSEHRYVLKVFGFTIFASSPGSSDAFADEKNSLLTSAETKSPEDKTSKKKQTEKKVAPDSSRAENECSAKQGLSQKKRQASQKHSPKKESKKKKQKYRPDISDEKESSLSERVEKFISALKSDADMISRFIRYPTHRIALKKLWENTIKLIRHIIPRKAGGTIRFGFSDPSLTGQCTGILYMLIPEIDDYVTVIPEYEKKTIKGRLSCKGRLRLFIPVRILLKLYFDRSVKQTYKHVKKTKFKTFKGE